MYQVTIKGRTLEELKSAVNDINDELISGTTRVVNGMEKNFDNMTVDEHFKVHDAIVKDAVDSVQKNILAPALEKEDWEDVKSPYSEKPASELPLAPGAITPMVQQSIELDVEGLPWDKRIHASSKLKVKAGTWRTKKNLDVALFAQIKEELRNNMQRLANPVAIPALPVSAATPVITPATENVSVVAHSMGVNKPVLIEKPVVPVTPPVVQAPVVAAPVPQPAMNVSGGHTLETFSAGFPMILATLISEKKVTQDYVNSLKTYFNVTEIWNVSEAQKAEMFESFAGFGFIQKVG